MSAARTTDTLGPGQFHEMVTEVRRALQRFLPGRNGDPKAGMAYTLLTVIGRVEDEMLVAMIATAEHKGNRSEWVDAGVVTQCNRTIQAIYFTLVDQYVIKPGQSNREKS